jgi:DNA replication licensing factor MCM4
MVLHSARTTHLLNRPCLLTPLTPPHPLQASLYNMLPADTKAIRDLDPGDLDKLVAIRGMVTRTSSVIPELRVAMFSCEACSAERFVHNENGKLDEPEKCAHCGSKFTLRMVHNRSEFLNKQHVKMQEQPDNIPEGETPHAVLMYAYELCVDQARPGDRVTITGGAGAGGGLLLRWTAVCRPAAAAACAVCL